VGTTSGQQSARRVREAAVIASHFARSKCEDGALSAFRRERVPMTADALLALGLLLSSSSQLRVAGLPIGPGEICMVIWLLLMLAGAIGRISSPLTPAFPRMLIFWAIFGTAQSVGTLTGLATGEDYDVSWFMHDAMAYVLLAAVSCMSVIDPTSGSRLRRVAWLLASVGNAWLALQLAGAWGLISIPIDPWFWERFRGWSSNPNQLSLVCAVLGLTSLYLAESAVRLPERIAAIGCLILPAYVGRLTQSDTFTITLLAAGPIFLAIKLAMSLFSSDRKLIVQRALAWVAIIALPLMLASTIPFAVSDISEARQLAMGLAKNNGRGATEEANLRLFLWREALRRGFEAGTLGLGPGPHLPIPPSIVAARASYGVQPDDMNHPESTSSPNFEAHNTVLDLFTQGGLIAVLSFLWLTGTAFIIACRARMAGLATLLGGLAIHAMSGLIVRSPLFWFAIALCLVSQERGRKSVCGQSASPFPLFPDHGILNATYAGRMETSSRL
jgi:hypothetical protein